jgi:hypothetical protein
MSFTLCSSGAIVRKAGLYVNSTAAASLALLTDYYDEAEGFIVAETRRDWVTYYSDVASGAKLLLADCCSDLAAIKLITYDMSGYTSLGEAGLMLDTIKTNANEALKTLKDFKSNEIKAP